MRESEVPVFVTGSTGFIGSELVRSLLASNKRVHALVRSMEKARRMLPEENIRWFKGDLHDLHTMRAAMDGCDRVYHLAGFAKLWHKDPSKFYEVNVGGLRNVLNCAVDTGVRKVVYTSTAGAIGPSGKSPVDENTPRVHPPTTDYERSKMESEQIIPEYLSKGLEVVVVNPTRVFGPGELNQSNSVTILMRDYVAGKWKLLPGDGSGIGNYAYVRDVVDGHRLAMKYGKAGERYILGGDNLSYIELFARIGEIAGVDYPLRKVPVGLIMIGARFESLKASLFGIEPRITTGFARKYLFDWETDHSKAREELGYRVTPFAKATEETLRWLGELQ